MDLSKRLGKVQAPIAQSPGEIVLLALVVGVMSEVKAQADALNAARGAAPSAEAAHLLAQLPPPSPSLSPAQVVGIQLAGLRFMDSPRPLAAIEKLFEFCTPKVKEQFGPYPRFLQMMMSPTYQPLHRFRKVEFGPVFRSHDRAWQPFTVQAASGTFHAYHMGLQKCPTGKHEGSWLVECLNPE